MEISPAMSYFTEYQRQSALRDWNRSFRTPPVCTANWNTEDHERWEESRKPLPPFAEWVKNQKPQQITVTLFGETETRTRVVAARSLKLLKRGGFKLIRERVRSSVGITAWHENSGFVAVSYKVLP